MHIGSVTKTLSAGANDFVYHVGNQDDLVLLGVNLAETDTPDGNPIPDSASVWLQDPTEKNTLSLCHGYMKNGQLAGYGCMPLQRGSQIVGKIWHARAGYHGKFCLFVATRSELGQFSPSWSPSVAASAVYPYGKLRVIKVEGTAADTIIELKPEAGYIWQVIEAWGYHDDATQRKLNWGYTDGVTSIEKMISGNLTTLTDKWYLGYDSTNADMNSLLSALILTNNSWATLTADALAAGKKIYIEALVLEHAE